MFKALFTLVIGLMFSIESFAAFSATKIKEGQVGGMRAIVYEVDFDSVTEGTIQAGLAHVYHASFTNEVSEGEGLVNKNSASASPVEDDPGKVHISDVTSSDSGTVLLLGY